MRAAVFTAPGAPLEVITVPDPVIGPDEILVRVRNCGVCGSDLHAAISSDLKMPVGTIMGHEFSGVVEAAGATVAGLQPGEPIAGLSSVVCGECAMCRAGIGVRCFHPRALGFGELPGAFAELVKTRPQSVCKMPAGVSFRSGAMLEPLVVGLHGLRRARFQAGESCLIMGAGSVGLATLLWARYAGARAAAVCDLQMNRRDLALRIGADAAIDPRMRNPVTEITRLTGSGPDVVFECIGAPGTLAQAISYAPRGGRVVVLGASMEDDGFHPSTAMRRELDVYFSLGLEPGEAETAMAALASGRIAADNVITSTVGLDDLPRAFAAMREFAIEGKLMLEF